MTPTITQRLEHDLERDPELRKEVFRAMHTIGLAAHRCKLSPLVFASYIIYRLRIL
jgi:hypothetical protein